MDSKPANTPALPIAGIYQHYKGQRYQLLYCARHSETEEWLAVYRCLYGDFSLWVRPLSLFCEHIIWPDGQTRPRFWLEIATAITPSAETTFNSRLY